MIYQWSAVLLASCVTVCILCNLVIDMFTCTLRNYIFHALLILLYIFHIRNKGRAILEKFETVKELIFHLSIIAFFSVAILNGITANYSKCKILFRLAESLALYLHGCFLHDRCLSVA